MAENEINEGSDELRISDRTERTSKHTADESISDSKRAERYEKRFTTFSDNDDDQSFKAIQPAADSFGIDFGDGTIETSKGLVSKPPEQDSFEQKGQEVLATAQRLKPSSSDSIPLGGQNYRPNQLRAANVIPNNPIRSDATLPNPDEVKENRVSETTISQIFFDLDHTPVESGEVLRPAIEAVGDIGKAITEHVIENAEGPVFPYRGLEDSKLAECTKENPRAWDDAISTIPALSKAGITSDHLKAIVRNELHWYDPFDIDADNQVKRGEQVEPKNTLGHAQVSSKGIGEFNRDIPEFKAFIESKNYKIPGDEQKVLEDPSCVPMITAAKMASMIKVFQAHNKNHPDRPVDINPKSLIYEYNADVQRLNRNGKIIYESMPDKIAQAKKLMGYDLVKVHPSSDPQILNASNHLRRVLNQLEIIRGRSR